MLTAKGYEVGLRKKSRGAANGRMIRPPKSFALLHDPSGSDWPRCSLLIAPFQRTRREVDYAPAVEYFGYQPSGGGLTLPPRDLNLWTFVCEVDAIDYWRPGVDYEGDYEHYFKGRGYVWGDEQFPKVYRRGRVYRLELGGACVVNWRGIVAP